MKKIYILISSLLFSSYFYTQVGINTESPKSTLDISTKKNGAAIDNTQTYGLQAPRLTREELTNITAVYGTDQRGALIYITDIVAGTAIGQRINVTTIGYYYFDGLLWQKITNDATVPTEPWFVNNTSTQATLNTQNIYQKALVGIGDFAQGQGRDLNRALTITGTGGANDDIRIESVSTIANSSGKIGFQKASNTYVNTDGTEGRDIVTTGERLGDITFAAYNNNSGSKTYTDLSAIEAFAETNTNLNNMGSNLNFRTSASDRMRISSIGRVGIGTITPSQLLDVNGTIKSNNLTNGSTAITTTDYGIYNQTNNDLRIATTTPSKISFYTDGATGNNFAGVTPTMVIFTKNVGIGIDTPSKNLDIEGTARLSEKITDNIPVRLPQTTRPLYADKATGTVTYAPDGFTTVSGGYRPAAANTAYLIKKLPVNNAISIVRFVCYINATDEASKAENNAYAFGTFTIIGMGSANNVKFIKTDIKGYDGNAKTLLTNTANQISWSNGSTLQNTVISLNQANGELTITNGSGNMSYFFELLGGI